MQRNRHTEAIAAAGGIAFGGVRQQTLGTREAEC